MAALSAPQPRRTHLLASVRSRLAPLTLVVLILADFLLLGGLALQRHAKFNSNAIDLGYHDQVIWNTLHGRPFRFTTYEQDERASFAVDVPLAKIRDPNSLLSYHVEPLLLLIAPIYWLWDDARSLLLLQALALALGAWPAYWLGCHRLGSSWAGVALGLLYLLAPARQAAALSDFHTVAFTAPFFLVALAALDAQKTKLFLLANLFCLLAREDAAIMVVGLALYAAFFYPRLRRPALILAGGSLIYLYVATRLIMPYYNGLETPTFWSRYTQFGTNLPEMVWNLWAYPQIYWDWLLRPDILAYLGGLAATGGWMALAAPEILLIALPVALLNTLANTGWPSSGGAHYSAAIVPFVIVAAIYGIERLARWMGGWEDRKIERLPIGGLRLEGWRIKKLESPSHFCAPPLFQNSIFPFVQPVTLLILLTLAGGLYFQVAQGVAPFSRHGSLAWWFLNEHERLGHKILALVPPDTPISAQSGLYPHLSQRERAYQFPTIADAKYIVLDVAHNPVTLTYDGYFQHVRLALINPRFGPLAAGDGYLLLQRGAPKKSPLIDEFLTFTLAQPAEIEHPVKADFGDRLRLEGYTLTILPVIDQRGPHVQLTTFWRALQTPLPNLRPVILYTRADGAIVYQQAELPLELYWQPSSEWQADVLYKLTTPELRVGGLSEALLAVLPVGTDPAQLTARLPIISMPGSRPLDTTAGDTLLRLLNLPR